MFGVFYKWVVAPFARAGMQDALDSDDTREIYMMIRQNEASIDHIVVRTR